jgi:putative metallohydrolase (TIGR04338 family)
VRDTQRSKVYSAQNVLHWLFDSAVQTGNPVVTINGVTVTLPPEAKFGCVNSIQTYLNRVMQMPDIAKHRRFTPTVRERKGTTKAHYQSGTIAIPVHRDGKWAMREMVVLHELAHHLAPGDRHGPGFVAVFLSLLGTVLGPEAELVARMVFIDNGVQTSPAALRSEGSRREDPKAS